MTFRNRRRAEKLKASLFFLLALMFFSANMANDKHVVYHSDLAKFISVDHQVRRDLSRAERENLKSSVMSGKEEAVPNPPQEAIGIARDPKIVVNLYLVFHSLTLPQLKSISVDCFPVLNL